MKPFSSLSTAMLKGFYRDKVSLFFAILFPLFFIIIFGTIFSGGEAARPIVVEVGAVPLIDQLPAEARAGLDSAVELVPGTTMDAALEQVQKGDAAPCGWTSPRLSRPSRGRSRASSPASSTRPTSPFRAPRRPTRSRPGRSRTSRCSPSSTSRRG